MLYQHTTEESGYTERAQLKLRACLDRGNAFTIKYGRVEIEGMFRYKYLHRRVSSPLGRPYCRQSDSLG